LKEESLIEILIKIARFAEHCKTLRRINLVSLEKVKMPEMRLLVAQLLKISWREILIGITCDVLALASDFKDSKSR
jgi:saccharopine dehydrogenase-like NADP-dependent oxidoreductase